MGVTGAWAAENGTGIPWFTAGTLCTPDDCTAVADKFPGAVAPLAPEGSGYPSFWNVLIIETILVGGAEAYRTGMVDPVFDELSVGDVSPGGRFDPLGLAESGDLEELKIKELKHCRLSMFAWLGCIMQALATQEGPIANWTAHTADPVHANVLTNAAKGFGFGIGVVSPSSKRGPGVRAIPLPGFPTLKIGVLWQGKLEGLLKKFVEGIEWHVGNLKQMLADEAQSIGKSG